MTMTWIAALSILANLILVLVADQFRTSRDSWRQRHDWKDTDCKRETARADGYFEALLGIAEKAPKTKPRPRKRP